MPDAVEARQDLDDLAVEQAQAGVGGDPQNAVVLDEGVGAAAWQTVCLAEELEMLSVITHEPCRAVVAGAAEPQGSVCPLQDGAEVHIRDALTAAEGAEGGPVEVGDPAIGRKPHDSPPVLCHREGNAQEEAVVPGEMREGGAVVAGDAPLGGNPDPVLPIDKDRWHDGVWQTVVHGDTTDRAVDDVRQAAPGGADPQVASRSLCDLGDSFRGLTRRVDDRRVAIPVAEEAVTVPEPSRRPGAEPQTVRPVGPRRQNGSQAGRRQIRMYAGQEAGQPCLAVEPHVTVAILQDVPHRCGEAIEGAEGRPVK